nr:uncharacterized protein LOC111988964 [Quercus suber]
MSKALNQISKSLFARRIEKGKLPHWFTPPTFTMYNGKTNPIEHMSHFNQRMAVYSKNKALMCKVFQSSLGPVAMRWFNGMKEGSINSFKELTHEFGARFVTCNKEGKTLKTYFDRYWKMFNEIEGNFDDVAIRTFKDSLPVKHDLRKSLTRKPIGSVRQLMDRIDEYKRDEEDQQ